MPKGESPGKEILRGNRSADEGEAYKGTSTEDTAIENEN